MYLRRSWHYLLLTDFRHIQLNVYMNLLLQCFRYKNNNVNFNIYNETYCLFLVPGIVPQLPVMVCLYVFGVESLTHYSNYFNLSNVAYQYITFML